ncbi:MAG: hypothetical protein RR315_07085, partial [Oscillospiraceae bacterium]
VNNSLYNALKPIKASEDLKLKTYKFIEAETEKRTNSNITIKKYALALCTFIILTASIFGYSLYSAPVSYISVDINPSLEIALNRLDRVVSLKAYNDDGAMVLENLTVKNMLYTKALDAILVNEDFTGFLSESSRLTFTVVSDREADILEGIKACHGYGKYGGECHSASVEDMKNAHKAGMSVGKYKGYCNEEERCHGKHQQHHVNK